MRRNLLAINVLLGFACAAFVAFTVLGVVYHSVVIIVLGAFMTLITIWVMAGCICRERIYEKFDERFEKKDFAAALTVLDKASDNHFFFPVYRTIVYQLYVRGELAVDNLAQAARYVDLLRHSGGDEWKYRTAFYIVLFNLDWGEYDVAKTEFDGFERACSHSPLYREQLEILRALFSAINGEQQSMPESVKCSPYPVVGRIVQRVC